MRERQEIDKILKDGFEKDNAHSKELNNDLDNINLSLLEYFTRRKIKNLKPNQ